MQEEGAPVSAEVQQFQVDLRGVVDLLSRHIYSSPRVYLRELLQNARDAITARREVDGVRETMLASTLRTLADDGLVHRESLPTVPPRVEYSLTPLGRDLMERMLPLMEWVADHADGMLERG